jgi:hypothetical protein
MARDIGIRKSFGWDDQDWANHEDQGWHGRGNHHKEPEPVSVDQLNMATFHLSEAAANGDFHDRFILQVNGSSLHGTQVTVPGLNSAYGLYLAIDLTGHPTFDASGKPINGGNVFDTLDVKVMLDPGHDDGTAHSTIADGLGFANGTADDIELAHGSIVSGHFVAGPDPNGHADFVESLTMTRPGIAFLGGSIPSGIELEEILTSPFSGRVTEKHADGSVVSVLNGQGTSTASLLPAQLFSLPGMDVDGSIPALLRTEFIAAHEHLTNLDRAGEFAREVDTAGQTHSAWQGVGEVVPPIMVVAGNLG